MMDVGIDKTRGWPNTTQYATVHSSATGNMHHAICMTVLQTRRIMHAQTADNAHTVHRLRCRPQTGSARASPACPEHSRDRDCGTHRSAGYSEVFGNTPRMYPATPYVSTLVSALLQRDGARLLPIWVTGFSRPVTRILIHCSSQ